MLRLRETCVSRQRSCQLLVLLLALGLAATASAQGERGVITGTVTDAQGGVLPGVAITVRNVDTGFTQTDVTGASGQYRFGAVTLGRYELKAELVGFTTATVTNRPPRPSSTPATGTVPFCFSSIPTGAVFSTRGGRVSSVGAACDGP